MKKRAIVLGGAGLLGSHLCVRLLQEGYELFCIDKRDQSESPLLRDLENRSRFRYIKHDITTPYEIGCDELYNLTALPIYGHNYNPIDDLKLASIGSINSLNNIAKSCGKVFYASSDDVYTSSNRSSKNSITQFRADACRTAESIHIAYHDINRIETRVARIFSTYGANSSSQDLRVINRMIIDALNNRDIVIYGSGEQVRTFCWVDDAIDGIIRLMRTHSSTSLITADIGSAHKVSINTLAKMIVDLSGSLSNIIHIEARPGETLLKVPNLKVMENEVGWHSTTPLREGLLRTINHLEKELSHKAIMELSWIEVHS